VLISRPLGQSIIKINWDERTNKVELNIGNYDRIETGFRGRGCIGQPGCSRASGQLRERLEEEKENKRQKATKAEEERKAIKRTTKCDRTVSILRL
jgi:hypothetical protein